MQSYYIQQINLINKRSYFLSLDRTRSSSLYLSLCMHSNVAHNICNESSTVACIPFPASLGSDERTGVQRSREGVEKRQALSKQPVTCYTRFGDIIYKISSGFKYIIPPHCSRAIAYFGHLLLLCSPLLPLCSLVLSPSSQCSLTAPSKAALLPSLSGNGNPQGLE